MATKEQPPAKSGLYWYRAVSRSTVSGSSVRFDIDLGFGVWDRGSDGKGKRLDLRGVVAPDVSGEDRHQGYASRDYLASLLDGREIRIKTYLDKTIKVGRIMADVWVLKPINGADEWVCANDLLIEKGYAVKREN